MSKRKSVSLLYHYFHPDDVISARLFSEIAQWCIEDGWHANAYPAIHSCHDTNERLERSEVWNGVQIRRISRFNLPQSSKRGRVLNAILMLMGWTLVALVGRRGKPDVMIVGTDPVLGVAASVPWRLFRPSCKIIHWCHDVYPEAAISDGILTESSMLSRLFKVILKHAYRRCDAIVDLGSCMRRLLSKYKTRTPHLTLTPWSLVEPDAPTEIDPDFRKQLFGDRKLGLLYSGNLGRAHEFELFVELARRMKNDSIGVCFAGRGPRVDELTNYIRADDANISQAGFVAEAQLEQRLSAADIHLVSLRANWTGTVVPSKFFGALATGRAVIFLGSPESCIAKWIKEYKIGWVLTEDSLDDVIEEIRRLAENTAELESLRQRCFETYHLYFSRAVQRKKWQNLLEHLTEAYETPLTDSAI